MDNLTSAPIGYKAILPTNKFTRLLPDKEPITDSRAIDGGKRIDSSLLPLPNLRKRGLKMYSDGSVQMSMFEELEQATPPAKAKYKWSVYAVTRYYDGAHIETIVNAYTEKQARFLFYKSHPEYMITGIYII